MSEIPATNHYLKFTGSGVADLGGISDLSITDNDTEIALTLDADGKVEIDEYLPMTDVTALYFVIGNAQYDDYKRFIVKSGDDEIGSAIADSDNYEFTIYTNNAAIDGDITVEVNPLPGLIYFNNSSSNDDSDYTATFYDSDDNVLATRVGTNSIYTDFNVADVAKIVFTRAEGDYEGIRLYLTAGNYDDGEIVNEEPNDVINTVTYTGDFSDCKYIGVEYVDY